MIAGLLLTVNAVLAAGIVLLALAPRPIVVVPSARGETEIFPGAVPEAAAREFALRYVLHFDNFTPATIEEAQEILRRMISARSWSEATKALSRRLDVVREGRMSSQVIPLSTRVEGLAVTVAAVRRTFIADKLSRERRVRYVVRLERQPPTEPNPYGLSVVSQEIHEEPEEAPPPDDREE